MKKGSSIEQQNESNFQIKINEKNRIYNLAPIKSSIQFSEPISRFKATIRFVQNTTCM